MLIDTGPVDTLDVAKVMRLMRDVAKGTADFAWTDEATMFDLIHQMRTRIVTSPVFAGNRIAGAIVSGFVTHAPAIAAGIEPEAARLPEAIGIGLAPQSFANADSERTRSLLSPAVYDAS